MQQSVRALSSDVIHTKADLRQVFSSSASNHSHIEKNMMLLFSLFKYNLLVLAWCFVVSIYLFMQFLFVRFWSVFFNGLKFSPWNKWIIINV